MATEGGFWLIRLEVLIYELVYVSRAGAPLDLEPCVRTSNAEVVSVCGCGQLICLNEGYMPNWVANQLTYTSDD